MLLPTLIQTLLFIQQRVVKRLLCVPGAGHTAVSQIAKFLLSWKSWTFFISEVLTYPALD